MEADMPKGAEPADGLENERITQEGVEQLVLNPGEDGVAVVLIRTVVMGAKPRRVEDLKAGRAGLEGEIHFLHAVSVGKRNVAREG
jgi:CO dehydrogenase/acetyl-CoA synthase alpha subunit